MLSLIAFGIIFFTFVVMCLSYFPLITGTYTSPLMQSTDGHNRSLCFKNGEVIYQEVPIGLFESPTYREILGKYTTISKNKLRIEIKKNKQNFKVSSYEANISLKGLMFDGGMFVRNFPWGIFAVTGLIALIISYVKCFKKKKILEAQ